MKKKTRQVFGFIVLIIVFVITVFICFWLLQVEIERQQNTNRAIALENEILTNFSFLDKQQLLFKEDSKRFLNVYFNQEFEDPAKKEEFIKLEYIRFSNYQTKNDEEKKLKVSILRELNSMITKFEQSGSDIGEEEQALELILKQLD